MPAAEFINLDGQPASVSYTTPFPVTVLSAFTDDATEAKQDIQIARQDTQITNQEAQIENQELQVAEAQTANELLSRIAALSRALGIASDIRVTLLGGTTAVTGTLTGVTTVTTVTTVTGLTNIGGFPAITAVPNWNNQTAIQSNINNVTL